MNQPNFLNALLLGAAMPVLELKESPERKRYVWCRSLPSVTFNRLLFGGEAVISPS